jgi:type VI secretion system secreted protein Hcp
MASDYFLKLDGIEGESQDSKHQNEIELESFSWGAEQPGSSNLGTGAGAGKVHMRDLTFTTRWSKASPKLLLTCANGKPLKSAVLTVRKAGESQQEYGTITLENAIITSYKCFGGNGDLYNNEQRGHQIIPLETFSVGYSSISFEYKEQKDDGTLGGAVKTGWDVKQNKAL